MLRPRAWSRWQWIIVPQGAPAHDALIFSLDRSLRTQLQSDAACYGERRADTMHTKKRRIRCAAGPAGRPRLRNRVTFAERASLPCLHHISSPKRTLRLESATLSTPRRQVTILWNMNFLFLFAYIRYAQGERHRDATCRRAGLPLGTSSRDRWLL